MKTLILGVPAFFVWGVVFFVFSFRVDDPPPEIDLTNEKLLALEQTNRLVMLNCSVINQRNDVGFAQLDLFGRELEFMQSRTKIDSVHIVYKVEIDSSILKQNHEREKNF